MDNPWILNSATTEENFNKLISKSLSSPKDHIDISPEKSLNQKQWKFRRSRARMSICAIRDKFRSPRSKNVFILFCSTTSMKGMNKISRGPKPLRILWIFFVIIMSTVLIVSSCLLVRDFMLYEVNIITKVQLNSQTPFPSITVCHHHPFSADAYKVWKTGKLLSPSKFNEKMRNITYSLLLENKIEQASTMACYDSVALYYQNLNYTDSVFVGHQNDTFLSCNHLKLEEIYLEDNCSKLEYYSVKPYSHQKHFNCFTFEAQNTEIKSLGIIVSMGPPPDYNETEQAFIYDTFDQAKGLKTFVHEPGTVPDIDNTGLHVEPGKMNDIVYRPIEMELVNTPRKPCREDDTNVKYKDLEQYYNYTQDLCFKTHLQHKIVQKCKCLYAFLPRIQIPNNEIPYCGRFVENFNYTEFGTRLQCVAEIVQDQGFKANLEKEFCFQRCNYMNFETSISLTKWRATEWHLHWIRLQLLSMRQMSALFEMNNNVTITRTEPFRSWVEYWESRNLTMINKDKREDFLSNENYVYIVLRRESMDSVKKYERLVITPYVLFSRIGGLCSLTVGITASFFVELVEFLYLYYRSKIQEKINQTKTEKDSNKNEFACKPTVVSVPSNSGRSRYPEYSSCSSERRMKVDLSNSLCVDRREILL